MKTPIKSWQRTRVQGLYRHANGNYYARTFAGKEKWHSHRTADFSTAKLKHSAYLREQAKHEAVAGTLDASKMTWGDAEAVFLARMGADPELKASTRHYKRQVIASLKADWPNLDRTPLRKISRKDCQDWSTRHAARMSPTRFNAALGILRAVLAVGVDACAIGENPATGQKRRAVRVSKPELPTRSQFKAVLETIRSAGGRFSKATGDFVEGLALTGLRLNEAASLTWADIQGGKIRVTGGESGTKNREVRFVPLNPDAEKLLDRMRETAKGERVFKVREAQKALDRATGIVGCARMTHHDLRHYFCTLCIEEGVSISTVAKWLGHRDGGALLMRVYGHLRDEHSMAEARRISFAPKESAQPPQPEP